MIQNDRELKTTLNRIEHFQKIVEKLKIFETNPRNYELSAGGFLSEIDRMNLEVAEYLSVHSSELIKPIADTILIKTDDLIFHPSELIKPIADTILIKTDDLIFDSSTWHGWGTSLQAASL